MKRSIRLGTLLVLLVLACTIVQAQRTTWTADYVNGTFTNPLFYEEFSDPDMIRVGEYFYLTGTTRHTMPGLTILRLRDLDKYVKNAQEKPAAAAAASSAGKQ